MQHQMMMENDINGLQQQDDAEYGDEMNSGQRVPITAALAEQRATKKRAQDDVKLLANRIALLKLEEKKVSAGTLIVCLVRFTLIGSKWARLVSSASTKRSLSARLSAYQRNLECFGSRNLVQ